eukprot:16440655-Heterocapsa_arctica.AAC.1
MGSAVRVQTPPMEAEVLVTHALEECAVRLLATSTWTMRDVKEALSRQLGRPEIAEHGRLVKRLGTPGSSAW